MLVQFSIQFKQYAVLPKSCRNAWAEDFVKWDSSVYWQ